MSQLRVDEITDEVGTGAPEITDHYKKSNILGTVSESSGVPTGAIIERGSNANGEYVKFADGTMICTKTDVHNSTFRTAYAGGFRTGAASFTLPASFVNSDYVAIASTHTQGYAGMLVRPDTSSEVTANGFTVSDPGNNVGATFFINATGRWY